MKHLLGPVLLVAALVTACGDATSSDVAGSASDPAASPSASAPTKSGSVGEAQTIAIVSQTAAGGTVDPNAVRLDDEAAKAEFVGQFRHQGLEHKIDQAIASATVPSGYVPIAAVIAVGCDIPPGVDATISPDGWVLTAQEVASPLPECLAPVTSVAVVAVPA